MSYTLDPADTLDRLNVANRLAERATEPVDLRAALAVLESAIREPMPRTVAGHDVGRMVQSVVDMVAIRTHEMGG